MMHGNSTKEENHKPNEDKVIYTQEFETFSCRPYQPWSKGFRPMNLYPLSGSESTALFAGHSPHIPLTGKEKSIIVCVFAGFMYLEARFCKWR
jgi:hypothetical protein